MMYVKPIQGEKVILEKDREGLARLGIGRASPSESEA